MHEQHSVFVSPSSEEVSIWRYMDLPKLAALLTSSSLWFARADLLGDPHEGAYGQFNHENRKQAWAGEYDRLGEEGFARFLKDNSSFARELVRRTHVSCWHMNEEESVAMWRAYAGAGQAVAVRSTYRRLCEAIVDKESVYIGEVNYVDPASTWIPEGNFFYPYVHKRRSFEYERELRAVTQHWPTEKIAEGANWLDVPTVDGVSIKVELPRLIEAIYVGPQQPAWFRDVVARVTAALAPGVDVRQSDLDSDPIY